MEMLLKAQKFDDKGLVEILRFPAQLKRTCILDDVYESMPLKIMPSFLKQGLALSLTVQIPY